jgi:hypothetical protein
MISLFLVCALAVPSPHFTHPPLNNATAVDYERAKIEKFIRNREYQLIKDKAGKIDLLLRSKPLRAAHVSKIAIYIRRSIRERFPNLNLFHFFLL